MRICIPLLAADDGATGDDSLELAAHFGLAERFAVIDSASGEILEECESLTRCPGPCGCPLPNLASGKVDALAGPALGFRLLQMSRRAALPVFSVKAKTLGDLRREIAQSTGRSLKSAICLTSLRCRTPGG
ncbi:MAG: hypothetical protein ACM3SV_08150 [Betaproteobacteria bacterium]